MQTWQQEVKMHSKPMQVSLSDQNSSEHLRQTFHWRAVENKRQILGQLSRQCSFFSPIKASVCVIAV